METRSQEFRASEINFVNGLQGTSVRILGTSMRREEQSGRAGCLDGHGCVSVVDPPAIGVQVHSMLPEESVWLSASKSMVAARH